MRLLLPLVLILAGCAAARAPDAPSAAGLRALRLAALQARPAPPGRTPVPWEARCVVPPRGRTCP